MLVKKLLESMRFMVESKGTDYSPDSNADSNAMVSVEFHPPV